MGDVKAYWKKFKERQQKMDDRAFLDSTSASRRMVVDTLQRLEQRQVELQKVVDELSKRIDEICKQPGKNDER